MAERRQDVPPAEGTPFARVANARRALAVMAAGLFPRQPPIIAAVTGTSGKTSVAAFARQIWTALGHRAASIGTIGVVSPRGATYGSLTTPDPVALHRTLDALAGDEVTHLAIEAWNRTLSSNHFASSPFFEWGFPALAWRLRGGIRIRAAFGPLSETMSKSPSANAIGRPENIANKVAAP